MSSFEPFHPLRWASGAVAQTALAQLKFRTWGANEMAECARSEVLRLSGGLTVQGAYSAQPGGDSRGLVVMLSGWEGHANSAYMLRMGRRLYRAGYEIFRLTYPDHGGTHDLNEAAFHFGMLDKMEEAIHRVVGSIRTRPVFLLGFSMGGNLTLNLACRGLPGLKAVFAVSPALDFGRALESLQRSFFHSFFLRSLKSSLERKQQLFPERHDFSHLQDAKTVGEVATRMLFGDASDQSFADYTARYALTPEKLKRLCVPAHVVAAKDDPIVGPIDASTLSGIDRLSLHMQERGGHVGFISSLFGPAYHEDFVLRCLEQYQPRPPVELPEGE